MHFNIYKLNFISIWRGTKMLNLKKIRTKLKTINEYWDQIEYKKLTLTRGMILAWHVDFFKIKKIKLKKN